MNYYDQLYDVDFFSGSDYVANVGGSALRIRKPGEPEWSSWKGVRISAAHARRLFNSARADGGVLDLIRCGESDSDVLVIALVLCEDAYRRGDEKSFALLNRVVLTSDVESVRLKAMKLYHAWSALQRLVRQMPSDAGGPFGLITRDIETPCFTAHERTPIGRIVAHAVD